MQPLNVFDGDALAVKETPFGRVGTLFESAGVEGAGLEVVWVSKSAEEIDPGWFSYDHADMMLVVQGQLKVEFKDHPHNDCVLRPGDCLVLPPRTQCRAYRWPRDCAEATVFVAAYPA